MSVHEKDIQWHPSRLDINATWLLSDSMSHQLHTQCPVLPVVSAKTYFHPPISEAQRRDRHQYELRQGQCVSAFLSLGFLASSLSKTPGSSWVSHLFTTILPEATLLHRYTACVHQYDQVHISFCSPLLNQRLGHFISSRSLNPNRNSYISGYIFILGLLCII
jgi:hypothetical protein